MISENKNKVIETTTSSIWKDSNGIIHIVKKPRSIEELNDAKENIKAILDLTGGTSHPAYVDLTCLKGQKYDAIEYYAQMTKDAKCFACAFLIGNMQSTAIGISNIRHSDPDIRTALFTEKPQAIEWLNKYL
jgi:hypothetical protein